MVLVGKYSEKNQLCITQPDPVAAQVNTTFCKMNNVWRFNITLDLKGEFLTTKILSFSDEHSSVDLLISTILHRCSFGLCIA